MILYTRGPHPRVSSPRHPPPCRLTPALDAIDRLATCDVAALDKHMGRTTDALLCMPVFGSGGKTIGALQARELPGGSE